MRTHMCDGCGCVLYASWWTGDRFGKPDEDYCERCYQRAAKEQGTAKQIQDRRAGPRDDLP